MHLPTELRIPKAKTDSTKENIDKSIAILNDLKTTLTINDTTSRSNNQQGYGRSEISCQTT